MARTVVFILVFFAFGWSIYVGIHLLNGAVSYYSPNTVFSEKDSGVLRINQLDEIDLMTFEDLASSNAFSNELKTLKVNFPAKTIVYLSTGRNILILESEKKWKKQQIQKIEKGISLANAKVIADGRFILIHTEKSVENIKDKAPVFIGEDKKASANFWSYSHQEWTRTDIYALERGYFEYRSGNKKIKAGQPIQDTEEFANVLPQMIESYIFSERFFSASTDSVFNSSPMATWVDKGYVIAKLNQEEFLVSDYRSSESPSIVLASNFLPESSNHPQIKAYRSIPLVASFPKEKDTVLYILELEDKVIITKKLATAIKIDLHYQLGETLALNQQKFKQLFSDLPQYANFRSVSNEQKQSVTLRNELNFTVTTKPPSEKIISPASLNWVNSAIPSIIGICPVPDHIRGGNSVFVYNQEGEYALVSSTGETIWKGATNSNLEATPQVVDIFENNKKQLLFRTKTEIHLIDLNGKSVSNFPYKSDQIITTDPQPFKWKNTIRFVFGNAKGELIVINNSGSELNITQAGTSGIEGDVFALNMGGNLRGWSRNKDHEVHLSYLETPAKAENKGKHDANVFMKNMGEIIGFEQVDENTIVHNFSSQQNRALGKGRLTQTHPFLVLKDKNQLSIFNADYSLRWAINIPFNEIGIVYPISIQEKNYLLVNDYLTNKVHLFDESGSNIGGFPKESSEIISYAYDTENRTISVYSVINGSLITYPIRF